MFSNYVIRSITEIIHSGLQIANVLNLWNAGVMKGNEYRGKHRKSEFETEKPLKVKFQHLNNLILNNLPEHPE